MPTAAEYSDCNKCPAYDTKQSDGKTPVMLELWGMRSIPLLPSLPGPLRPGVVPLEIVSTKLPTYAKLNCMKQNCLYV